MPEAAQLQPMSWGSFAKGITDQFVDPAQGYARKLDNLLVDIQGKPYQRAGGSCANWGYLLNNERPNKILKAPVAATTQDYWWFIWGQRACYWNRISGDTDGTGTLSWAGLELTDPSSNKFLPSYADANTRVSAAYLQSQIYTSNYNTSPTFFVSAPNLPVKIWLDAAGDPHIVTCGLPPVGISWKVPYELAPQADLSTAHSYLYWACYKKTYTLEDGSLYIMYGPYIENVGGPIFKTNPIGGGSTTALYWGPIGGSVAAGNPVYVSSMAAYHDDVTNWTLEIFRTTDGGSYPYWLMSLSATAGATTTDSVTDATLVLNATTHAGGYWQSGEVSHSPVERTLAGDNTNSKGRFNMIANDCGYWDDGFCTVYQSIPGIPDALPGSFGITFSQRITGMAAIDIYPLVGCEKSLWRLDGQIDNTGAGTVTKSAVSTSVGVLSHASMVVVGRTMYFAGTDGFYMTNGWTEPTKISRHLDRTYKQITATYQMQQSICGCYHDGEGRIYWSVMSSVNSTDNDMLMVLDLNQGQSDSMTFTTWSTGNVANNFFPTAMIVTGKSLVTADRRGYFRTHTEGQLNDDVIDVNNSYANWSAIGVGTELQSPVTSFGMAGVTKWVSKFLVSCQHRAFGTNTTLSLLCSTERDKSGNWKDCATVYKTGLSATYDQMVKFSRRVGPSGFRSNYWCMRIKKSKSVLYKSDTLGTAHQATATTLVLDTGSWPTGLYGIAGVRLVDDQYVTEYPITSQSGNTLTCSGGGIPTGTGKKWEIFGYAANEFFAFDQINVPHVMFSDNNVLGHAFAEDNTNA